MIEHTIAHHEARDIYNQLGSGLERAQRFERQAKAQALALLELEAGQRVLHVGVGTGLEHAHIQAALGTQGLAVGYDLSRGMLQLTGQHGPSALCEGDALRLPFHRHSFERIFSAYMLDLLAGNDMPIVLSEFRRVLKPTGRLVLVSLTEGIDRPSRLFVAGWKLVYRLSPQRLGGCRPIQLSGLLTEAGFCVERRVLVQRGFPSEVLVGA